LSRTPEAGTTELDGSYLETVTIHGREFQSYSINHRIYFGPVDDVGKLNGLTYRALANPLFQDEAERLELQQRVFNRVFDDRLIFPPVSRPKKVLDCGYGSGAWAVEVAEEYPECEVRTPVKAPFSSRGMLRRITCPGYRGRHISSYEAGRDTGKPLVAGKP
jgi:hypothetical protein